MAGKDELEGDVAISVVKNYSDVWQNTLNQDNVQLASLQSKMSKAAQSILAYFVEDQTPQ